MGQSPINSSKRNLRFLFDSSLFHIAIRRLLRGGLWDAVFSKESDKIYIPVKIS